MRKDLRFAIRQLLKQPGFTLMVLLTLALGIGANTAIFSVAYGVLLRPLPYPDPSRIVGVTGVYGTAPSLIGVTWSEAQFFEQHNTAFSSLAASTSVGFNLMTATEADRVDGLRVSAPYFDVLGVHPLLGRTLTPDEDQIGGPDAVVLSYGVWQRLLGGECRSDRHGGAARWPAVHRRRCHAGGIPVATRRRRLDYAGAGGAHPRRRTRISN